MMRALTIFLGLWLASAPAFAQRDAAFVAPASGGGQHKDGDDIIAPSPKALDLGETAVGVTKRVTLFFTNYSGRDAKISGLSINADSNVRTNAAQNDCATVDVLHANDKCTVIIEITPNSPGKWTAEVVAVHDAAGRVSRATLTGTTSGEVGSGQVPGLSLVGAAKDQLIDFGDVPSGNHAVRTLLLANDSTEPLQIQQIQLMAPGKGLDLMEKGGCKEGDEIPAGASCPVTVEWEANGGEVSTDLIIRHTGPIGFAVIPVRGKSGGAAAAGAERSAASLPVSQAGQGSQQGSQGQMAIPPVSADALFARAAGDNADTPATKKPRGASKDTVTGSGGSLLLRGTTGDQALLDNGGQVTVVGIGQSVMYNGKTYQVVDIQPTSVLLQTGGRVETLPLQPAPLLISASSKADAKSRDSGGPAASKTPAK